jgi:predicted aspartyl protease
MNEASMSTEIPFRFARAGMPIILIPVSVNGQGPFDFVLDTGNVAAPFLLSGELSNRLGISTSPTIEAEKSYAVGSGPAPIFLTGEAESIVLGDLALARPRVAVGDMLDRLSQLARVPIHGNVGYHFLKDFQLTIDYTSHKLLLAQPGHTGNGIRAGQRFQLAAGEPLLLVAALVNGTGPYCFAVDTGAGHSVLSPPVAEQLGLGQTKPVTVAGGAGEAGQGWMTRVESLEVGSTRLENLTMAVADFFESLSTAVGAQIDGVLGHNFLSRFKVVIDYPGQTIFFEQPTEQPVAWAVD